MKILFTFLLSAFCFHIFNVSAFAATYYVDFASGSDTNNGISTSTPFQHCPGDLAATGNANKTLSAGDTVNFKGGVVYYDSGLTNRGSFPSTIYVGSSGTSNSPVTFQTAPGWGTGPAVFDGIVSGWTNQICFNVQGDWIAIQGVEIRNYLNTGVFANYGGNYLKIANCVIHHIGTFPDACLGIGTAYTLNKEYHDVTVVSNTFYDCINSTCSTAVSNYIFYANEVYSMGQHGMQPSPGGGYLLIANNYFHDNTNTGCGAHCDAIQIFPGSALGGLNTVIIANNKFYNDADDIRFQYDAGTNMGNIYVFNNVCWSPAPSQSTTFSSAINVSGVYCFNNTFLNMDSGPGAVTWYAGAPITFTNVFELNNLYYFSSDGILPSEPYYQYILNGYNLYTNTPGLGYLKVAIGDNNAYTLGVYQAAWPTNEIRSITSAVTFVDYANKNFQLAAGSGGIGQGTNMTSLVSSSTFSYIPAAYRPDPTKDIAGVQRGTKWDIGAYQFSTNTQVAPPPLAPPRGLITIPN